MSTVRDGVIAPILILYEEGDYVRLFWVRALYGITLKMSISLSQAYLLVYLEILPLQRQKMIRY